MICSIILIEKLWHELITKHSKLQNISLYREVLQPHLNKQKLDMKAIIIVLAVLLAVTQQNMSVYNLQSLGHEANYQNLESISFSIANFGFVPFGKTMIGQLVVSPNLSDECEFQTDQQIHPDQTYFMIVPRGHCKFVKKAINAQKAGAKVVIIMDNETDPTEPFIMADNGEGYKVNIPAVFVNHTEGEKLIELVDEARSKQQGVSVKISFENTKTEKVLMKLFLEANNRRSYRLVNGFREYYESIAPFVDLQVLYHTEYCEQCLKKDCYSGDQYCSYHYRGEEEANGRLILDQQIREKIVFEKYPSDWWSYMAYIGDECSKITEFKECSEDGLRKVGINPDEVQSIFESSFNAEGFNSYLESFSEGLTNSGIYKYPSVSLNNYNIRGSLSAEYLFDDICNTLTAPPPECSQYVNETVVVTYVKEYWVLIILVVLGGFAIFSGLFVMYKRYMKRRMSVDMQQRVDDMVGKYIEFYSERSREK